MTENTAISPELKDLAICNNIGFRQTRQKISFSDNEVRRLIHVQKTFNSILSNINLEFLPLKLQRNTKRQLLTDLLAKKEINIVSVFCPSYKQGLGEIGYCNKIGSSTKSNVDKLINLEKILTDFGCSVNILIFFSDLLIENFDRLKNTDFRDALKQNYSSLVDYCPANFRVELLSSLGDLSESLNEEGARVPIFEIDESDLSTVEARDLVFYQNNLGWTKKDSKKRTRDLSINYPYIARAINDLPKNMYLYWSESAYERYLLMPNLKLNILFPKKKTVERVIEKSIIDEAFDTNSDKAIGLLEKCIDHRQVVFEQGLNYFFDYIAHGYELLLVKTKGGNILPITFNSQELILSYPLILDWVEMDTLIKLWKSNFKEIYVKYLSEEQAKKNNKLEACGFHRSIRSSNELFYSATYLTELAGRDFAKLRHKKNKIFNSSMYSIQKLSSANIIDAEYVIDKWRCERSHIYAKDRSSKEKKYLKYCISNEFESIESYLLYADHSPVGVLSVSIRKAQNVMCVIILKGLNSTNIAASDYLYFFVFNLARTKNIELINDGDLGIEEGTKLHKSQFKPIVSRMVYDYVWR